MRLFIQGGDQQIGPLVIRRTTSEEPSSAVAAKEPGASSTAKLANFLFARDQRKAGSLDRREGRKGSPICSAAISAVAVHHGFDRPQEFVPNRAAIAPTSPSHVEAPGMPHNGYSHNLRDPLKRFCSMYQTSSPGHASRRYPRPEGHIECRRRNPEPDSSESRLVQGIVMRRVSQPFVTKALNSARHFCTASSRRRLSSWWGRFRPSSKFVRPKS
jgi:hypothetical protein